MELETIGQQNATTTVSYPGSAAMRKREDVWTDSCMSEIVADKTLLHNTQDNLLKTTSKMK